MALGAPVYGEDKARAWARLGYQFRYDLLGEGAFWWPSRRSASSSRRLVAGQPGGGPCLATLPLRPPGGDPPRHRAAAGRTDRAVGVRRGPTTRARLVEPECDRLLPRGRFRAGAPRPLAGADRNRARLRADGQARCGSPERADRVRTGSGGHAGRARRSRLPDLGHVGRWRLQVEEQPHGVGERQNLVHRRGRRMPPIQLPVANASMCSCRSWTVGPRRSTSSKMAPAASGRPSGSTRFGTSRAAGAWRRLLPRATSIMRNVCLVAARPSAESVTGTRMASAIISAVASVGMWSGGRSRTTRRSAPASSPARSGQRPEP